MANICIISSDSGFDAENIINYFKGTDINVSFIVIGKFCGVNNIGYKHHINHTIFIDWESLIFVLDKYNIDLVILSSFKKLVPKNFLKRFKTINSYPSLLGEFKGKGMYGLNLQRKVINSDEKESGISIHWVNEEYGDGEIISQFKCDVYNDDNPSTLESRIKKLEYDNFHKVIESILQ